MLRWRSLAGATLLGTVPATGSVSSAIASIWFGERLFESVFSIQ